MTERREPKIGLALGGGGAKGLSHILMLEAFEELGLRPAAIAGTSIGAIIGACYCAGCSAPALRAEIEQMSVLESDTLSTLVSEKNILQWLQFIELHYRSGGMLKSDRFIRYLFERIRVRSFEDLQIPLVVVATDLWRREQRVFDAGPLAPAVQASMSIPGAFAPVVIDGAVMVDGVAVNPVPFDLLPADCDLTVAIDVIGQRDETPGTVPSMTDALLAGSQVMQKTIIAEKRRRSPPGIYIDVVSRGVQALEFYLAETVFQQAEPSKAALKQGLSDWLARNGWAVTATG